MYRLLVMHMGHHDWLSEPRPNPKPCRLIRWVGGISSTGNAITGTHLPSKCIDSGVAGAASLVCKPFPSITGRGMLWPGGSFILIQPLRIGLSLIMPLLDDGLVRSSRKALVQITVGESKCPNFSQNQPNIKWVIAWDRGCRCGI
jgi:hypothetical protein